MSSIIRIPPLHYIHTLDNNTNVASLKIGPDAYILRDHETVVTQGAVPMIRLPPRRYCTISSPVKRQADGSPVITGQFGLVALQHGEIEIRTPEEYPDPFPLYPGERLVGEIKDLQVLRPDQALRLQAKRDFVLPDGTKKRAGDEWLFKGPGTYKPHKEVNVKEQLTATVIKPNTALKIKALANLVDRKGIKRVAGEEWLVRETGAFLADVEEQVVGEVKAHVLTESTALHLHATNDFTDIFGTKRKAGQEWLVTLEMAETHICDVYETLASKKKITSLTNRQYCVVLDPVGADGTNVWGKRELRSGECSFFLQPGEQLENGIQDLHILSEEEALLLRAAETFQDGEVVRHAGDRWMIYGPCDFLPPVEVVVEEARNMIPLDENEGIYVRDVHTGKVRAVVGQTYMLKPQEQLWKKELPRTVEELLSRKFAVANRVGSRDKTRVVTCRAPHNTAVQVYDYRNKQSRVVFGPELVLLGPDENFTLLNLSGGTPKGCTGSNVVNDIALQLGPEFSTDMLVVETSDHARLSLRLSYNWFFDVKKDATQEEAQKIFQIRDFVGDFCKAIASRVRGCVASTTFEEFHKNSSSLIRAGVFGVDANGTIKPRLHFPNNNLVVTSVDIQSVEPVDPDTRASLAKSVQLAIEITTRSQEAAARHEAERLEQEAKGRIERQKLSDQAEAEESKKRLLLLKAESAAVQTSGQATADARARADAEWISAQGEMKQAELRAQASAIECQASLEKLRAEQTSEIAHQTALDELEIHKAREVARIETSKLVEVIQSIDKNTIIKIAMSGPELQKQMLSSLGVRSMLVTDRQMPINMFTGAPAPPQALGFTQPPGQLEC